MKLPPARCENIVEQRLEKEILLYDLTDNKAYNLNETAAIVYQYCDGKTTLEELAAKENLSQELILYSLTKLEKENLISFKPGLLTGFEGLSRRQIIRKIGISGLALLPVISTLVAPSALQAQSVTPLLAPGNLCNVPTQCQSNVCVITFIPGAPIITPGIPPITIPGIPPVPPITTPGFPPVITPGTPIPGPLACA